MRISIPPIVTIVAVLVIPAPTRAHDEVSEIIVPFSAAQGSTDNASIAEALADLNCSASIEVGRYVGLHPRNTTNMKLYFQSSSETGEVVGRIDFLVPVRVLELDVIAWSGGECLLTAYDEDDQVITSQTGLGHMTFDQEDEPDRPIAYIRLDGLTPTGGALNIDNLRLVFDQPQQLGSDVWLAQLIYDEYPQLVSNLSDWETACILREFSYVHTPWATRSTADTYDAGEAADSRTTPASTPR